MKKLFVIVVAISLASVCLAQTTSTRKKEARDLANPGKNEQLVSPKKEISKALEVYVEYNYTSNNSNISIYSYNRNIVSVGLNAQF